jgi:hypothetical protein
MDASTAQISDLSGPVTRTAEKGETFFVIFAAAVLALTGAAKVYSAFGRATILTQPDPVFGIVMAQLMLAVGIAELLVAGICFFPRMRVLALTLVAWLATSFLVYRTGLAMVGAHFCPCMGTVTDALHIPLATADFALKTALANLLVGSYWFLFRSWITKGQRT